MISFIQAALRTWLLLIRRPGALLREGAGAAPPWPFAVLVYLAALASALVMHLSALGHGAAALGLGGLLGLGLGALALCLWVGLCGALLHGGLLAVGARGALRDTYACLCYASAPLVFLHVPYAGLVLAPLWTLALGFFLVRARHRLSRARAVAALLVPAGGLSLLLLLAGSALTATTVRAADAGGGLLAGDRLLLRRAADGPRKAIVFWSSDGQGVIRLGRIGQMISQIKGGS